jgi:murein DD-endopeptidase MepM/ murein hydrolase activator NlpD
MKKIILVSMIVLAGFLFSKSAFAVVDCSTLTPPYSCVPANVYGTTYDSMISWNMDAGSCYFVYYNVGSGANRAYPSNDYQHLYIFGQPFFFLVSVNGIWFQDFGGGDWPLSTGSAYLSSRDLYDSTNQTILINENWDPPACTSWTYSDWSACQQDNTQTRTILTSSPSCCSGGSPVLSQTCVYAPPLTVTRSPESGGGVASSDDEIQCGVNQLNYCQVDYPLNSEVELEAIPNSSYAFAYWEWNEGASSSTNNPETFTMDAALEVTAVFYPTFAFPLQINNYTPYTAPISTVFDHSGSAQYSDSDHIVIAFTGEMSENQTAYPGSTCYEKNDSSAFGSGFNYTGTSGTGGAYYLCYNGHPGTDYPAANNTPIYAVADGIAHIPSSFPGVSNAQTYNTVEIDHQNGYKTYYLHFNSQNVTENQQVYKGQTIIGYSGDTGASGAYHLHLEVQRDGIPIDPYGWTGSGADPYTRATNITLWE